MSEPGPPLGTAEPSPDEEPNCTTKKKIGIACIILMIPCALMVLRLNYGHDGYGEPSWINLTVSSTGPAREKQHARMGAYHSVPLMWNGKPVWERFDRTQKIFYAVEESQSSGPGYWAVGECHKDMNLIGLKTDETSPGTWPEQVTEWKYDDDVGWPTDPKLTVTGDINQWGYSMHNLCLSDIPVLNTNTNVASATVELRERSGQHRQLPFLNITGAPRFFHTMDGETLCGGKSTNSSCITLNINGIFWKETSATLKNPRYVHSSWASPSGLILMGGAVSPNTTEKIQEDGTSVRGYDLQYNTSQACAINLGATVLITGGLHSRTIVAEYSEDKYLKNLPELLQGRHDHGCTYYENDEGTKTYLVTGGYDNDLLSSTELLKETDTTWAQAGVLPTPRFGLRVATVDNRVLSTGGYDGDKQYEDILEFRSGEWIKLDKMLQGRSHHAVSVLSVPIQNICVLKT